MSAVGSILHCWWEDDDLRSHNGSGLIIRSSRSKRSISDTEALEALRDGFDDTVVGVEVYRWHRVTLRDLECGGLSAEAELGSWDEDATGAGWIDVALPTFAPVASPSEEEA